MAELDPFRQKLLDNLSRDELLELIKSQNPKLIAGIERIEYVFKYKLRHLKWESGPNAGLPIEGRPLTNLELCLLVDEPFKIKRELTQAGLDEEQQRKIHIAKDPVTWARSVLRIEGELVEPRVYQIIVLRHPSLRRVLRQGRRSGKSFSLAIFLLHYAYTHNNAKCLVITPMKEQGGLVYTAIIEMVKESPIIADSIQRKVTSPQHYIKLSNGSEIKFFSTGVSSGGKASIVRGQEADVLVLDELDYMHPDDIVALYAMLQRTRENQEDKILIAASTPTGQRTTPFYSFCFPADTIIQTHDGIKKIIDITPTDSPLDSSGNFDKIAGLYNRQYTGNLFAFKTYYGPKIISTNEHSFLVRRNEIDQFIPANQITKNDFFKVPIRPLRDFNEKEILKFYVEDDSISIKYKEVVTLLDQGFTLYRIAKELSIPETTLRKAYKRYLDLGFFCDRRRSKAYYKALEYYLQIQQQEDQTVLGLYLAEGHIGYTGDACQYITGITFTFHMNEWDLINRCIQYFQKIGIQCTIEDRSAINSVRQVHIHDVALGILFKSIFREKENKRMPVFLESASEAIQDSFVEGLLMGDKELFSKTLQDFWSIELTAQDAITDIYYMMLRRQNLLSLHYNGTRKLTNDRNGRFVHRRERARLAKPIGYDKWAFFDNESIYLKVREIDQIPVVDYPVYNFETINTHTYAASIYAVHNSHNPIFTEFWWPCAVNVLWTQEIEDEQRTQYTANDYAHEFEADWGEDITGVYPRRYLDRQFLQAPDDWDYLKLSIPTSKDSFFVMGVDWDKYGAGTNFVILEACGSNFEDPKFRNKIKCIYREEVPKDEYTYLNAVNRIIELHKIFSFRHIYVDAGSGECVSPNTLISTIGGISKPISEIQIGDMVLTVDNNYHKVIHKIVRDDEAKDTYRIRCFKNLPVEVSDTHPFLVREKNGNILWKNVTELSHKDMIASPKLNKSPIKKRLIIDIVEYLNLSEKEYGFNEKSVWALNTNGVQICPINRYWDLLSEDFLLFAGWYLSEGSVSHYTVELPQETSTVTGQSNCSEILRVFRKVTGREPYLIIKEDNRKESYKDINRYQLGNKVLALFVSKLMGKGSENKHIPSELIEYYEYLGPLFRSMLAGDGHFATNRCTYKDKTSTAFGFQLSLTSFTFIEQMRLIFSSLGIAPSLYVVKDRPRCKPQLRIDLGGGPSVTNKMIDYLQYPIPNRKRIDRKLWKEDDNFIFYPIRKIEYIGKVSGLIDIAVEGGESFVGNGLLLHNTQCELLHKYGLDHPETKLRKVVKRVGFGESIEITDPETFQKDKKPMKPFMVDNLHNFLEKEYIYFSAQDEELYIQLASYVIKHVTEAGRPVFEPGGNTVDHAHDALILACLAITQNYGDLMRLNIARYGRIIEGNIFQSLISRDDDQASSRAALEETNGPVLVRRAMAVTKGRRQPRKPISRRSF